MDKKLLIIDVGYLEYTKQFYAGCKKCIDTKLITKCIPNNTDKNILQFFYKYSENMNDSKIRTLIRGVEYFLGYLKILHYIKKEKFDYIHIQWAIIPYFDTFFFKLLKRRCDKLVFTAHDAIPHILKEGDLKKLEKVYSVPDQIVVHGKNIYNELIQYFPQYKDKIYIQNFGVNYQKSYGYSKGCIEKHIEVFNSYNEGKKIVSFIGQIFYNKGTDRLLKFWLENMKDNSDSMLVIVGRIREHYQGLDDLLEKIKDYPNVYMYLDRFTEEEEAFFYDNSSVVVLPYRHASMSGVFFSAAQYKKTILVTDVGSLAEYIPNNKNVFLIENDDILLNEKLNQLVSIPNSVLEEMGNLFYKDIYNNYSWDNIIPKLISDCYKKNGG